MRAGEELLRFEASNDMETKSSDDRLAQLLGALRVPEGGFSAESAPAAGSVSLQGALDAALANTALLGDRRAAGTRQTLRAP